MDAPGQSFAYDLLRLNYSLYPGVVRFRSARFVAPYYEAIRARQNWIACFVNLIVWIGFHLWLPWRTREVAKRWHKDVDWRRNALAICRQRFADPNDIAMFRIESASELDDYMRRFEHIGIGRAIADPRTDHSALLTDKRVFYAFCAERQIPHPRVFALVEAGRVKVLTLPEPGDAILLKPANGSGGRGVQILDAPCEAFGSDDDFAALLKCVSDLGKGEWVVQKRVFAHPDLRDLALSALPSVRVTTIVNEAGKPEIVTTVLRFPKCSGMVIDNIGKGGLNAPVDLASGRLGPCCAGMEPGEYDRHPESGAEIEGRVLPHWARLTELAIATHALHFSDHVMIGWDMAIAADGPMFLEANPRPSIIMAQRAPRLPAGRTRLGELIGYHLERRLASGEYGHSRMLRT